MLWQLDKMRLEKGFVEKNHCSDCDGLPVWSFGDEQFLPQAQLIQSRVSCSHQTQTCEEIDKYVLLSEQPVRKRVTPPPPKVVFAKNSKKEKTAKYAGVPNLQKPLATIFCLVDFFLIGGGKGKPGERHELFFPSLRFAQSSNGSLTE